MNDKFFSYLLLFAVSFILYKCSESQNGMIKTARDNARVSSYLSYLGNLRMANSWTKLLTL